MLPRHHAWSLADLASDSLHLVSQVCLQPTFHYYDCIQKSILVTVLSAQLLFFFNYEKFIFVCICIHIHVLSRSVTHNSLRPHRLQSARLLCPWDFPGKNIRVGCRFLLQGIFPIQGPNLGLLHCRRILYQLSHQGSPYITLEAVWLFHNLCQFRLHESEGGLTL